MIITIIVAVISFVAGILVGKANKSKVSKGIDEAKKLEKTVESYVKKI